MTTELLWSWHHGDARRILPTLPASSVQCVVTSPPYYGLRDYGHDGQVGLEVTPAAYIGALVDIFAQVRRTLRDDGVVWLNLGDTYASNSVGTQTFFTGKQATHHGTHTMLGRTRAHDVKPKNLVGIPWRVALALQADGWWLRSDVIWHKPNPMPESVTDRPTKAHEYVFLLTKSDQYAYDIDAIRETYVTSTLSDTRIRPTRLPRPGIDSPGNQGSGDIPCIGSEIGRNARSVWTIPTESSPGTDHFAVMPRALARRCIMAGCPPGGTVLDPFAGIGTTGVVALEEGRSFVGIELNPKYHALGRQRLANVAPLLANEAASNSAVAAS